MFTFTRQNSIHWFFGLVLAIAGFIRFYTAPFSTGPDVAQFWAFAEVFRQHGIDFYRYAGATENIFPFSGWMYAYPPVWLLILGLALFCVPDSLANTVFIDSSWRLAVKTPIIISDLVIGILLYWSLPGSGRIKLLFSSLWLLNPTSWYNSAVFGQFDAIAAALLVASLVCFAKKRIKSAFFLGILAGMTKQTSLIPLVMMTAAYAASNHWSNTFRHIALMAAAVIVTSTPFLLTGNWQNYLQALFLSGQRPEYTDPLMYSFNGPGSLATYLHQVKGWDTSGYFWFIIPVMLSAGLITLFFIYRQKTAMLRAAMIGIVLFVAFYYRINYQYLVLMIPLALMIAAATSYRTERIISMTLAILPAAWLWMFDVYFWFYCYEPKSYQLAEIFTKLGLARSGTPDYLYVILALLLTILCLSYILLAFFRWTKPLRPLFQKHSESNPAQHQNEMKNQAQSPNHQSPKEVNSA